MFRLSLFKILPDSGLATLLYIAFLLRHDAIFVDLCFTNPSSSF